jgi:hypothetical protein
MTIKSGRPLIFATVMAVSSAALSWALSTFCMTYNTKGPVVVVELVVAAVDEDADADGTDATLPTRVRSCRCSGSASVSKVADFLPAPVVSKRAYGLDGEEAVTPTAAAPSWLGLDSDGCMPNDPE